eukprot:gene12140-14345_t
MSNSRPECPSVPWKWKVPQLNSIREAHFEDCQEHLEVALVLGLRQGLERAGTQLGRQAVLAEDLLFSYNISTSKDAGQMAQNTRTAAAVGLGMPKTE